MPRQGPCFSSALTGTVRFPLSSSTTRRSPAFPDQSPHLGRLPGNPVLPETAQEFKQTFGYSGLLPSPYPCQVFFAVPPKLLAEPLPHRSSPVLSTYIAPFAGPPHPLPNTPSFGSPALPLRFATCTSSPLGAKSSRQILPLENSTGIFFSAGSPAAFARRQVRRDWDLRDKWGSIAQRHRHAQNYFPCGSRSADGPSGEYVGLRKALFRD